MANDIAIERRPEQAYVGTRTVMPMDQFDRQIAAMTEQVAEWMAAHGLRPAGNPFLRYHTIDMPHRMDVELGIPVDRAPDAGGALRNAVLPAGRYAVLNYRGVRNAVAANKRLLEWICGQGEHVASRSTGAGEAFEARYETFLTKAGAEPDQDQWEIAVAMKLRA